MLLLVSSLAMLAAGPVLYRLFGRRQAALAALDAVAVVSVGALVLMFILPESIEIVGVLAMVPFMVGLLLPTLVERTLGRMAAQADRAMLVLVIAGLAVHQLLDGVALALPNQGGHGHALPAAVVMHQLPAGLVLWRLLNAARGRTAAVGVMIALGVTIVVGFAAGDVLGPLSLPGLGLFNALVAGSLLHVIVHYRHLAH